MKEGCERREGRRWVSSSKLTGGRGRGDSLSSEGTVDSNRDKPCIWKLADGEKKV